MALIMKSIFLKYMRIKKMVFEKKSKKQDLGNGLIHYEYKVPVKDQYLKLTGDYKTHPAEKTVYDTTIWSDSEITKLCIQAGEKGYTQALDNWRKDNKKRMHKVTLKTKMGDMNFKIYLDKQTGKIENIHPSN